MEFSIVHNIDLVKALNELKSFNTYTACARNNILRIIESCFFSMDTGEATSDHMSHLKGRMDYGHQAIGVMLASDVAHPLPVLCGQRCTALFFRGLRILADACSA